MTFYMHYDATPLLDVLALATHFTHTEEANADVVLHSHAEYLNTCLSNDILDMNQTEN